MGAQNPQSVSKSLLEGNSNSNFEIIAGFARPSDAQNPQLG
jgi:hypothetical protein